MIRFLAVLSLLLTFVPIVDAKTISLEDGAVTFEAPDEFDAVPDEILAAKYPASRAPRYVIGNEDAGTTIACDLKGKAFPDEQIEEVRAYLTGTFERVIPGAEWIDNKVIDHAGKKWIYFELTSNAVDTDIHNIMLFTGYRGQTLMFNFNSTRQQFERYEDELRRSMASIKFR
ncbi:MAG: hypothetical protein AAGA21_12200 [Pseudomonadota bacterium]